MRSVSARSPGLASRQAVMRLAVMAVLTACGSMLSAGRASAVTIRWLARGCESPGTYYSAKHVKGRIMCCTAIAPRPSIGVCPGGLPCPPNGVCAEPGATCVPTTDPMNALPNILVITTDDQGSCDFGFSGTCRADKDGQPVPAPYTPALDALAARGKVFPVAHNAANWCIPSRESIVTGRLLSEKGCVDIACRPPGARADGDILGVNPPTISQILKTAGPGYCSYQSGKGGPRAGFDAALPSRGIGRTKCQRCGQVLSASIDPTTCQFDPATCPDPSDQNNPACATQPQCGEDYGDKAGTAGEAEEFFTEVLAKGTDNKTYLPKKFFFWYAPGMPHIPVAPPDVVEHRPHASNFTSPELCKDFLFGFLCDQQSNLLGPRFPFASPAYASSFAFQRGSRMEGLYGNVWWTDNGVRHIRQFLASDTHMYETATGPARLSENTVIMVFADNGAFLPRSKKFFTENGFRTPMIIYDPRHETPVGGNFIVDTDIAHSVDVLATAVSYAGVAKPTEAPGKDLRGWLENPTPTPVREALCGTATRILNGTKARYILPRGGRVGQCGTPTGGSCANDSDCSGGALCAAGSCAAPSTKPCVDDDDCRLHPDDPDVCAFQDRKWCSNPGPLQACTSDATCHTNCRVCQKAPSRTCLTNADCGKLVTTRTGSVPFWGFCQDAPGDKLACTCGRRVMKLYHDEKGLTQSLTDLLSDPDETNLVDGGAVANASTKLPKLAQRLRCCLDQWWLPPGFTPASCPDGCDPRVDCRP